MSIGKLVEELHCYHVEPYNLTTEQRAEIIEFALGFEECLCSRAELEALETDGDLVRAAYSAMYDYAMGQMP